MLSSYILGTIIIPAVLFLIYCFLSFSRATHYKGSRDSAAPANHQRKQKPRPERMRRAAFAALALSIPATLIAQANQPAQTSASDLRQQVETLTGLVHQLEDRVNQLEGHATATVPVVNSSASVASTSASETAAALESAAVQLKNTPAASPAAQVLTPEDRSVLNFLRDTTFNVTFDGYYEYNFNQPIGRVNLLRAYDVSSDSFSINQAGIVIENAPNPSAGKRYGARVDLQYGQATETLQGSTQNELRPQVYRNLWQAYGTYVAPIGSGLTVDFGKWASALGVEGNYTKDQINYSRSYFFDYLPFYHMGFRASYNLNNKVAVTGWLVNGTQQTEDFNGFKSVAALLTIKPVKSLSWNVNYYTGQEQRDVVANYNPGLPTGPAQPGLPTENISPTPNGREHILDTYATWNATSKFTVIGEGDYVINRVYDNSAPAHVSGGAAYARYQLAPKWAVAGRAEYLSDRGGLFSGTTQALKETTTTAEYELADGFLIRGEWRRDFSNVPFFLTDKSGVLKHDQNTSTLGMVWWFGRKQGAW